MASLPLVIDNLVDESRALWLPPHVAEYSTPPQTLPFLRDHVAQSTPCVWRAVAASWPATTRWPPSNFAALRAAAPDDEVAVTWTPNGRADSLVRLQDGRAVFATPHQTRVRFPDFLDALLAAPPTPTFTSSTAPVPPVPYYSPQDASLARELRPLRAHLDERALLPAFSALGEMHPPNLWIGDQRSVTATHADPFDNLYVVLAGAKTFYLRPPCDAAVLPKPSLPRARWAPAAHTTLVQTHTRQGVEGGAGAGAGANVEANTNTNTNTEAEAGIETQRSASKPLEPLEPTPGWMLLPEEGETAWVDEERIPPAAHRALRVELHAGDLMYLPALWFHRVEQSGVTIAANWWFEMTFGRDWVYRELCAQLGALATKQIAP